MAPKKRAAKAAALPAAPGPDGGLVLDLCDGDVDRANADHHLRLSAALDVLAQHDLFANLSSECPLAIAADAGAASGVHAPFVQASYETSMQRNFEYTAGINIFWHGFKYTATPGIPLRSDAIDTLVQHYFPTPARYPGFLHISVPSLQFLPMEHKGALQSVSPEEMRVAFLLAIARDIQAGAPRPCWNNGSSFPCLARRRSCWTSNLPTSTSGHASCVKTWQSITTPCPVRLSRRFTNGANTGTAAAIAGAYAVVKTAKGREPVSASFVETSLTVHKRLLTHGDIASLCWRWNAAKIPSTAPKFSKTSSVRERPPLPSLG